MHFFYLTYTSYFNRSYIYHITNLTILNGMYDVLSDILSSSGHSSSKPHPNFNYIFSLKVMCHISDLKNELVLRVFRDVWSAPRPCQLAPEKRALVPTEQRLSGP
jgi:hypothetical protein